MKKEKRASSRAQIPDMDNLASATEMTGLQPFLQSVTQENPPNAELIPIPAAKVTDADGK